MILIGFASGGCPNWEEVSAAALKEGVAQRTAALYAECHYERFDLLAPAEFEASWQVNASAAKFFGTDLK